MLIEVTRFQFQLVWCSHGDINDPWYLYLVGRVPAGDTRAACLGIVRKFFMRRGTAIMWYAASYEEQLSERIQATDRRQACEMAVVAILKQTFSPNTATAEWAIRLDMGDADEWVMPLLSDIKASYAKMEPVCLLK